LPKPVSSTRIRIKDNLLEQKVKDFDRLLGRPVRYRWREPGERSKYKNPLRNRPLREILAGAG
jgi:trehalose utilization protein